MEKTGYINFKFTIGDDGIEVNADVNASLVMMTAAIEVLKDKLAEGMKEQALSIPDDVPESFGEFLRGQLKIDLEKGVIGQEQYDQLLEESFNFDATEDDPTGVRDLCQVMETIERLAGGLS